MNEIVKFKFNWSFFSYLHVHAIHYDFFSKQLIGNISNVLLICFTIKFFVSFSNWQICCNLMLFLSRRNFFKCVDFETCTVLIYVQCFHLLRVLSFYGYVSVMEGQKNLILIFKSEKTYFNIHLYQALHLWKKIIVFKIVSYDFYSKQYNVKK